MIGPPAPVSNSPTRRRIKARMIRSPSSASAIKSAIRLAQRIPVRIRLTDGPVAQRAALSRIRRSASAGTFFSPPSPSGAHPAPRRATRCAKHPSSRTAVLLVADPRVPSEPFVEQMAVWTIRIAKEHRNGTEALRCNIFAGENRLVCFWTSNHKPSHNTAPNINGSALPPNLRKVIVYAL